MTHTSRHQRPIKITKLALIAAATVAATIALPATASAHADGPVDPQFQSPSGNIRCSLAWALDGAAYCEIRDHTWVTPVSSITGKPCDSDFGGLDFVVQPGKAAYVTCYTGAGSFEEPDVPTLGYGQTRSVDTIACDSEPTGMTCTDSSTGHFFRVSREFYQLG
jgi:hypothetical protein